MNLQNAVRQHSGSVLRVAFSYVRSMADAEDIAQDVFLAYLKSAPVFESPEHEKAWLIKVAVNKSRNYIKSGWWNNREALPEDLSYLPEEDSRVLEAVMELDEKYRLPIHLHYYEGYSIREIAQALGARPATIGTRLARGRELLKGKLRGLEDV
ncbi:MAG: sigma-70 family RNA polymerase sigma factor [Bacillota bacterium]|nr:sigma-70 family RNA polymerase sigma factor [Bacillota bacterium]